jgi:hypothetical protein
MSVALLSLIFPSLAGWTVVSALLEAGTHSSRLTSSAERVFA